MNEIIPGCWIDTKYFGEAVCVKVEVSDKYTDSKDGLQICGEGKLYSFRYEAIKCSNNKMIWVLNSLFEEDVEYLKEPDSLSLYVLKLSGPYGEGEGQ